MELNRTLSNGKTKDTGEARYAISDVCETNDGWGFEVQGLESGPLTYLYSHQAQAEVGRAAMLKALSKVVGVTFRLPMR